MPELTREEKLKLIQKLPQRLQDFLYSEDTGAFLLYLGSKYKLPDEKVSALSKLVGDIILKITPITSLAQEIAGKVISDPQTAMAIAQELNNELLMPALAPAPTIAAAPAAPVTPSIPPAPTPVAIPKITPPNPPLSRGGEGGVISPQRGEKEGVADKYREPITEPAPMSTAPVIPKIIPTQSPPYQGGEKEGVANKYHEPIGPEIIDLRKTPPSPRQSFSEGGLSPRRSLDEGGLPSGLPISAAPIPPSPRQSFSEGGLSPRRSFGEGGLSPRRSLDEGGPPTPKPLTFTKPVEKPPLIEADPHKMPVVTPAPAEEKPQFIIRPPGLPPTDLPRNVLDLRKDKGEF